MEKSKSTDDNMPLEESLRSMIAQQATMIEELRLQNTRELEKQRAELKEEIIRQLKPMLSQGQTTGAPRPDGETGQAPNQPPNIDPQVQPRRRRRPRPRPISSQDKVENEPMFPPRDEAFVSIRDVDRGFRRSGLEPRSRAGSSATLAPALQASPLLASTLPKPPRRPRRQRDEPSGAAGDEEAQASGPKVQSGEGEGDEGASDEEGSDEELAKYGYKNALWLTKSRSLLETVKDDAAIARLYDEQGKERLDVEPPTEQGGIEQGGWGGTAEPRPGGINVGPPKRASARRAKRGRKGKAPRQAARPGSPESSKPSSKPSRGGSRGSTGRGAEEEEEEYEEPEGLEPSSRFAGAPSKAGEYAWENEIARNILNLYATKVQLEDGIEQVMKQRLEAGADTKTRPDPAPGPLDETQEGTQEGGGIQTVVLLPARDGPARETGPAEQAAEQAGGQGAGDATQAGTTAVSKARPKVVAQQSLEAANRAIKAKVAAARLKAKQSKIAKQPEIKVVVPRSTPCIWFVGSGNVTAEWTALQPGDDGQKLQATLDQLEEAKQYTKYSAMVLAMMEATQRAGLPGEVVGRLWRQLVVTLNAFAQRCVEQGNYPVAMELLAKSMDLAADPGVFDLQTMTQLKAFANDTYAYYYYKRGKAEAALGFASKAMQAHVKQEDWAHVAKAHLHSGCILSKLGRRDEAVRCNAQVLGMVEQGRLEVGGTAPQRLCLVAVCYHNIAVEQLHLRLVSEACVSAQNARRLARLCLSYSTRFLTKFEATHQVALEELSGIAADKNNEDAARLFKKLLKQL